MVNSISHDWHHSKPHQRSRLDYNTVRVRPLCSQSPRGSDAIDCSRNWPTVLTRTHTFRCYLEYIHFSLIDILWYYIGSQVLGQIILLGTASSVITAQRQNLSNTSWPRTRQLQICCWHRGYCAWVYHFHLNRAENWSETTNYERFYGRGFMRDVVWAMLFERSYMSHVVWAMLSTAGMSDT